VCVLVCAGVCVVVCAGVCVVVCAGVCVVVVPVYSCLHVSMCVSIWCASSTSIGEEGNLWSRESTPHDLALPDDGACRQDREGRERGRSCLATHLVISMQLSICLGRRSSSKTSCCLCTRLAVWKQKRPPSVSAWHSVVWCDGIRCGKSGGES